MNKEQLEKVYSGLDNNEKIYLSILAISTNTLNSYYISSVAKEFFDLSDNEKQTTKSTNTYYVDQVILASHKRIAKQLSQQGILSEPSKMIKAELLHPIMLLIQKESFYKKLCDRLIEIKYYYQSYEGYYISYLRIAIYNNDEASILDCIKSQKHISLEALCRKFFTPEIIGIEWALSRKPIVQKVIFHEHFEGAYGYGNIAKEFPDFHAKIAHYHTKPEECPPCLVYILSFYQLFEMKLNVSDLKTCLTQVFHNGSIEAVEAGFHDIIFYLLTSTNENSLQEALSGFEILMKNWKKLAGRKKFTFDMHIIAFYIVAQIKGRTGTANKFMENILIEERDRHKLMMLECLNNLIFYTQGLKSKVSWKQSELLMPKGMDAALLSLVLYWIDADKLNINNLITQFKEAVHTQLLASKILADIILKLDPKNKECQEFVQQPCFSGMQDITDFLDIKEGWQLALDNLDLFFGGAPNTSDIVPEKHKRLVWCYDIKQEEISEILEQTYTKNSWSKGKQLTLKKLCEHDAVPYATFEDRKIIKAINKDKHWSQIVYNWDRLALQLALVGHPCVVNAAKPSEFLTITSGKPELIIKQLDENNFHIALSHESNKECIFTEIDGKNLIQFVHFEESFIPLTEILGKKGIKVPAKAKDYIISIVQKAGLLLPIHSDVEEIDIQAQEGCHIPHIHLEPRGENVYGLFVQLLIRPFGDKGPYYKPAHGRPTIQMIENMQPIKAKRDFEVEKNNAAAIVNSSNLLKQQDDGSFEWEFEDPYECLEVLAELKDYEEQSFKDSTKVPILLEWPKGRKINLTEPIGHKKLNLKVKQSRDWFNIDGEIQVDENTVLTLKELLALVDQSKGRFIQLDQNRYIALTNGLKKQLQELKYLGEMNSKQEGINVHALGAHSIKNFIEQVDDLEVDKNWQNHIKSLKLADEYHPQLPSSLQAELRDYQKEGFEWMSKLAKLGMGACLADDMGLGKTVQSIGVLLDFAAKGPCLVVAPTSVCHNWHTEIKRFAPTLNTYGFEGDSRQELIENLKEMDVLICSYTLLQQEIDFLSKKEFSMIVLDEAQAIKNASTKRFQAAIQLQGNFKLALSGTPIENSLEELWSLFRFIAPGLLGSREAFAKRFLTPLEKEKEQSRRQALKNLIKAFILRRTKSTVLSELPPKTEQTILIDMEPEEKAFYEAVRQTAIDNLSKADVPQNNRKIHILAELTRLRRACCHPKLIDDAVTIPSSKLRVFLKVMEDILGNHHKVLVFSQYVGYLTLVREALDNLKIDYQYLDGSTPATERQKRVQEFQQGNSSVFLLSLKAGGAGLNLTAADFVIHLDPWWNPAVEDQASDRAHRMGQTRPVTIYRLVVRNSIEERILALHNDKRELADELLDGSETPHKLSESDLLSLLEQSIF